MRKPDDPMLLLDLTWTQGVFSELSTQLLSVPNGIIHRDTTADIYEAVSERKKKYTHVYVILSLTW